MKQIKVDDTIYDANVDFRNIIKCNQIAEDGTIGDFERVLGIIETIFGDKGIDNPQHYEKLFKWAYNYITMGIKPSDRKEKPDFDLIKDKKYIVSSFKYDYNYNPYEIDYLSWEDFYNDLANLSNSEFGNCCVLSRVINLRNTDTSKIKDPEQRRKIEEAKKLVSLEQTKKRELTKQELENMNNFFEQIERS